VRRARFAQALLTRGSERGEEAAASDIAKDVADLVGRGIEFEEYDMGAFKTVDHVVTTAGIGRSAWFKDPDGNTIAVFQPE
jgi:uncharacterized protein with PhoU and TrkA domain